MAGRKVVEKVLKKFAPIPKHKRPPIPRDWRETVPPEGIDRDTLARLVAKSTDLGAPAVHTKGLEPLVQRIFEHSLVHRAPTYDPVTNPSDEVIRQGTAAEDAARTKELVPQVSRRAEGPPRVEEYPQGGRINAIDEASEEIAQRMADELRPRFEDPNFRMGGFYSTGPVIDALDEVAGLRPGEGADFMKRWAGQGAAMSPQTETPPNMRNDSYVLWRMAQGDQLTYEKWLKEAAANQELYGGKNRPGYPIIGQSHLPLSEDFFAGTVDPWVNTKPFFFEGSWGGNMADITADSHWNRKVLDIYDELYPGALPPEFFVRSGKAEKGNLVTAEDAYQAYLDRGGFGREGQMPDLGNLDVTPESAVVPGTGGRKAQVEYPIFADPGYRAAELLGREPSEIQSAMWFVGGPRTGLRSPEMNISDLLNSQVLETARATGLDPRTIFRLFARSKIPMAEADVSDVPGYSTVG